jgi:hypothetical protein
MERGLLRDQALELDDQSFTAFAFGTHPDAYWEAGLYDIPLWDKILIGLTPDKVEWLSKRTRDQAVDVGGRYGGQLKRDAAERAHELALDVKDFFRTLVE